MQWYTLKSQCINEVARELGRAKLMTLPIPDRGSIDKWRELQKEAEPEAIEKIQAMSNMELIELISEVLGRADG